MSLNLFKKKNKGGDGDESGTLDSSSKKASAKEARGESFKRFKKKIRITLKRRPHGDHDTDAEHSKESADKKAEKKAEKERLAEEKKRLKEEKKEAKKKDKEKKADKNRGKDPAKDVSSKPKQAEGDGEDEDGGKKLPFPILPVAIIGAVVILGGAIFGVVTLMNRPSQQDLLLQATLLRSEGKYSNAQKIYKRLLKDDPALVQAHLGLADSLVGQDKVAEAIDALNLALEPTENDPVITAKIELLSSHLPPEEGAEPPESAADTPLPDASPAENTGTENVATPAAPPAAVAIVWKDAALEKAVRNAVDIPDGQDITDTDAAKVTMLKILGSTHSSLDESLYSLNKLTGYEIDKILYTERGTIRTLDDLAHFKNLKKLIIGYNSVEDISGLAGLQSLDTLGLYFNNISDISAVSDLKALRFLYLYNNRISDVTPVSELTGLRQLWLSTNNITDISAVKNLKSLTELYIGNNNITDISAVSGLSDLNFLFAENNKIQNISPVSGLKALTDASFKGNPVSDLSPAGHIVNLN